MPSIALLTAGDVMTAVRALMNDTASQQYTNAIQVPYLNIALTELRELLELSDAPTVVKKSVAISIPIGQTYIGYDAIAPIPALPDDFVSPINVWARNTGTVGYYPVTNIPYLPEDGVTSGTLSGYLWANQRIQFIGLTQIVEVKLDYNGQLFIPVVDNTTAIGMVNGQSFLQYRTAGLVAEYVEENVSRANNLNNSAGLALDRVEGINAKLAQNIVTRRRPFRAGYKTRN